MSDNIKYRILVSADKERYRQIRLECLQKHPEAFGKTYDEEVNAQSLPYDDVLLQPDSKDFLMGVFEEKKLIGICGFRREMRIKTRHHGNINHMYVQQEFAGKGIGTRLLKATLDRAFAHDALEFITLGVVRANENAIAIYKKAGFVQYGLIQRYFKQEGSYWDFVMMVLTKERYLAGN